jgi:hypothetical protein
MDPLSITVGVFGLVSSVTTLSLRANEFSHDFNEASKEMEGLSRELADLTMILQRLQSMGTSINLPSSLTRDLGQVLQNCNQTVVKMEVFLQKASTCRMRAISWALSGKKECLQICRAIEAHKSTIGVTLALSSMYVQLCDSPFFEDCE